MPAGLGRIDIVSHAICKWRFLEDLGSGSARTPFLAPRGLNVDPGCQSWRTASQAIAQRHQRRSSQDLRAGLSRRTSPCPTPPYRCHTVGLPLFESFILPTQSHRAGRLAASGLSRNHHARYVRASGSSAGEGTQIRHSTRSPRGGSPVIQTCLDDFTSLCGPWGTESTQKRYCRPHRLNGDPPLINQAGASSLASSRIISDPFSPIMIVAALVLPETILGMTEASTTRSPSIP